MMDFKTFISSTANDSQELPSKKVVQSMYDHHSGEASRFGKLLDTTPANSPMRQSIEDQKWFHETKAGAMHTLLRRHAKGQIKLPEE